MVEEDDAGISVAEYVTGGDLGVCFNTENSEWERIFPDIKATHALNSLETGKFFMIGRIILLIDTFHLTSASGLHNNSIEFFPLKSHI